MKKLLSAALAILLLSPFALPALASEEYVYPPTQAVAENYNISYLVYDYSHDNGISRSAAVTGFYIYFEGYLERISLYEFSDMRLFRDGAPVGGVALETWVDTYSGTDFTQFTFSFTQSYHEPGIYHLEYKFQGKAFETAYELIEAPLTGTPADKEALDRVDYYGSGHALSNYEDYGVYNISSRVDGLYFTFKGRQDAFSADDLQALTYTRNGISGEITRTGEVQRVCWLSYGYGEEPTEKDTMTNFNIAFAQELSEPGVYTISGRYQGVEFRTDDILVLSLAQTESLLHAHKWAHEKLAYAFAHGLVTDGTPARFKETITRAEFCGLAVRYIEAKTQMGIDDYLARDGALRDVAFSDTGDAAVLAMARLGIVSGVGGGLFRPDWHITRQEAAQIVSNLQRYMGEDVTNAPRVIYKDSGTIAQWAKSAVDYTRDIKVLEGDGVYFRPLDNITHEESVIMWENLYRYAMRQG